MTKIWYHDGKISTEILAINKEERRRERIVMQKPKRGRSDVREDREGYPPIFSPTSPYIPH